MSANTPSFQARPSPDQTDIPLRPHPHAAQSVEFGFPRTTDENSIALHLHKTSCREKESPSPHLHMCPSWRPLSTVLEPAGILEDFSRLQKCISGSEFVYFRHFKGLFFSGSGQGQSKLLHTLAKCKSEKELKKPPLLIPNLETAVTSV